MPRRDGGTVAQPRAAWHLFATNFHLFAGTPSELWIAHALDWAFGITETTGPHNADRLFDEIGERLKDPGSTRCLAARRRPLPR